MVTQVAEKKTDWLPPVAITLGTVGVFTGLYFWTKKPPKEVKEGEWAGAGIILARKTFTATVTIEQAGWKAANQELTRKTFQVTISEPVVGDWLPAYAELARKTFQVTITEPVVGDWLPAYAELARKTFQVTIAQKPLINFQVSIWGIPPDFGSYQYWFCYYWDPGIGDFVSDQKWYRSYDKIPFSKVQSGGFLVVYLLRDSTVSSSYISPIFEAVNGGVYQYDLQLGRVI